MKLIRPLTITDSVLTSSNVTEDDYTEWNSGTAYVADDYVIIIATHLVWKCIVANTNKPPATNIYDGTADPVTGYWTLVSATNRWKMFDGKSRAATTNTDSIIVVLTPGEIVNSIALLNLEAASVNVTITDPTDGEIYNEDIDLVDNTEATDYYPWFFGLILRKSNVVLPDLPAYSTAVITITVKNTGDTAELGECVLGLVKELGRSLWGFGGSFNDYSVKTVDPITGDATITEGQYADTLTIRLRVDSAKVYDAKRTFAQYRATPLVFIGTELFSETIIYGFRTSFDVITNGPLEAICSLEIEELI